ncbi:MAG: hypothetical protein U0521_14680 [Anaerolineae bacterium]
MMTANSRSRTTAKSRKTPAVAVVAKDLHSYPAADSDLPAADLLGGAAAHSSWNAAVQVTSFCTDTARSPRARPASAARRAEHSGYRLMSEARTLTPAAYAHRDVIRQPTTGSSDVYAGRATPKSFSDLEGKLCRVTDNLIWEMIDWSPDRSRIRLWRRSGVHTIFM